MSTVIAGDFTPYLDGIRSGHIALTRCTSCDTWVWPPTPYCSACHERAVEWVALPVETGGTIFSFVIVRHTSIPEFKDLLPYVLSIVTIDGTDIRLVGRVLCAIDAVSIGDRVSPVFQGDVDDPVIDWKLDL